MGSSGAFVKKMQFTESVSSLLHYDPLTFQTWLTFLNHSALLEQLVAFYLLCIKVQVFV